MVVRTMLGVCYVGPRNPRAFLVLDRLHPYGASQILRLQQPNPESWIFWDYAGRLGALAILAAIPSARAVAFRSERLRIVRWEEVAFWIVGVVLASRLLGVLVGRTINTVFPATVLGTYPRLSGWLYSIDIVFGLALVAYSEEILFRRCARHIFSFYMDDGYALVIITSVLFGAYHWWTGVGNIVAVAMMGVLLMLFVRRSAALWPVVLAHYLIDIIEFS